MNDIRRLIQEEIAARENEIAGFEAAITEAREFVTRLRQALALINGEVADGHAPAPIPHDQKTLLPEAIAQPETAPVESSNLLRSSTQGSQRVTRTQSGNSTLEEERCGCGRPSSHHGRCAHRRKAASASREHKAETRRSRKSAAAADGELKPIRSHDVEPEPEKPKEIRTAVARPEKRHSCGQCVTRYINGTPFFSAQPDCPEHGLGYGTAQPGREQRAAPPVVN